jgi:hypothetical protein
VDGVHEAAGHFHELDGRVAREFAAGDGGVGGLITAGLGRGRAGVGLTAGQLLRRLLRLLVLLLLLLFLRRAGRGGECHGENADAESGAGAFHSPSRNVRAEMPIRRRAV